jgi:hypothetical protein
MNLENLKSLCGRRSVLSAAGALLALVSGSATAGQGYVHADICAFNGNVGGAYYLGSVDNTNTSISLELLCPVTQSDAFNTAPQYAEFQFNGYDRDATGVIFFCTGVVEDTSHNIVTFVGQLDGPGGTYTGPINLKGSTGIPGLTSYAYTARCDLPPRSSLYNVRVGNPT